jgi:hypothetical protein
MERRWKHRSIFWPLMLVAVGIFLLLNTMGYFPGTTSDTLFRLWPLLFVIGGIDSLYRGESFVGPAVAIGGGTIFLLANFGYLSISSWRLLLQFWPVLLIALGIDLLIGRRSTIWAIVGVLLGITIIGGMIWLVTSAPVEGYSLTSETILQPLKEAPYSEVVLKSKTGILQVEKGTGNNLVEGVARLANTEKLSQSYTLQGDRAKLEIASEGLFYFLPFAGQSTRTGWDLKISEKPTLDFRSQMITGEQRINLNGLKIQNVDVETVIGQTILTLPAKQKVEGKVSVVIGSLVLRVPRGAEVEILSDTGISGVSLPLELERSGGIIRSKSGNPAIGSYKLKAEVPIGSLRIETIE